MDDEFKRIGVLSIIEAKKLEADMKEKNIEIMLKFDEETCTRGCSKTLEVWAKEKDFPVLGEHFQKDHQKMMEGLDFNPELMDATFDPNKEEATCPACGTVFSTKSTECPDCGLMFG
jgi:hypothetical protein